MTYTYFTVHGVNPEPWTAPGMGVVRGKKGPVARAFKDEGLNAYQETVKSSLAQPGIEPLEGPVSLTFFLWRQIVTYETASGKESRGQAADATNLQKALEDALQGVLIKNDRQVQDIRTIIVSQTPETEPLIVIRLEENPNLKASCEALRLYDNIAAPPAPTHREFESRSDLF